MRVLIALLVTVMSLSVFVPPVQAASVPKVYRIMTVGDSITVGVDPMQSITTTGGYRSLVAAEMTRRGFYVDMVGDNPDHLLTHDQDTSGHNGWTTGDLLPPLPNWVQTWQPDIVLIMAGTNDVFQPRPDPLFYQGAGARVYQMILRIHEIRPGIPILVAPVPPSITRQADLDYVNGTIIGSVAEAIRVGHNVKMVYHGLTQADLSDGVHLTPNGYRKLANAFLGQMPMQPQSSASVVQCQNRPPVRLTQVPNAQGYILTVTAGYGFLGSVIVPRLPTNATVRTGRVSPTQIQVIVTRTGGGPITTAFTAYDDCGPWQSFSGIGA